MSLTRSLAILALFVAAMCLLAMYGATRAHAAGEGAVYVNIFEDNNYGSASRKVEIANEGSVSNLYNLNYNGGLFGCHGDQWPDVGYADWHHCISSFIPNWNTYGCIQLWTGSGYAGGLIYSKTVRPGDAVPSADFTQTDLGTYNDRAMSIHLGSWTGSRNAGHCVWAQ